MAATGKYKRIKLLCVALTGSVLLGSMMLAGCSEKKEPGNDTGTTADSYQTANDSDETTEESFETRKTSYTPGPSFKEYYGIYSVQGPFLKEASVTYDQDLISGSNTAFNTAASEKYLYTFNYHTDVLNVYRIHGVSQEFVFEYVTSEPVKGPVECRRMVLSDGDYLTIYPTSEGSYSFFFVENVKGKETVLSCFDSIHVCSDGQTIFCSTSFKLHYDPATKSVTEEPFSLDSTIDWEEYYYEGEFITEESIFVMANECRGYQLPHVFEYDLNGHFIREIQEDPRTDLYFRAMYDFDDKLLVFNYAKDETIELWDKEGNYIAGVPLHELGLPQSDIFTFDVGSILKWGDDGDYFLICSESFDTEKTHTVSDLVYRIHIIDTPKK